MSNTSIVVVEAALDRYVQEMARKGVDPQGFSTKTLAAAVGLDTSEMSTHLQEYRKAQHSGDTRFVVGAQGYGPAARWKILRKPGSDPTSIRNARIDHYGYVVQDAVTRLLRDFLREVEPGLSASVADGAIRDNLPLVADMFGVVANHVVAQAHRMQSVNN